MDKTKLNLIKLLVGLFLIGVGAYLLWGGWIGPAEQPSETIPDSPSAAVVNDFDACVAAGNPIMESWPRQCRSAAGQLFVEDIGNELESVDLIRLDEPRPNQLVASPLRLTGEARGYWYFEADFPVRLLDANGVELAVGPATAQSDWMVEGWVPFVIKLEFDEPATDTGTLVLERDNSSGLPENDDALIVPVRFR